MVKKQYIYNINAKEPICDLGFLIFDWGIVILLNCKLLIANSTQQSNQKSSITNPKSQIRNQKLSCKRLQKQHF